MSSTRERRLTGRQLTVMFVAGCLTLVLLPWGAWAAGSKLVTISSPGGKKVAVTKDAALKVTGTTLPAGKPFQVHGSASTATNVVLGHGKVALTDLVVSHDNSSDQRLNATFAVLAGNDDCSALTGDPLGYLLDYGYIQVQEVVSINLATPLVVTAPTVCLRPSFGSPAGLIATWTVGGYTY